MARVLKVWPGDVGAVTQSVDGELRDYYHCKIRGWDECFVNLVADDCGPSHEGNKGAAVSRAEWQAAVDALNAPKVVEWDGSGLPPVGSVVDTDHKNKELRVKILAYGAHHGGESCALAADMSHGREGKMFGWMSGQCNFRPVRTAEQVAAEERKSEILEMIDTFGTDTAIWGRDAVMEICGHLWESGYRKEKKQCGS